MILGSHNSFSFLRPKHWWGYLMIPFARCQSKTIEEQLNEGVQCFDIRISFDKNNELQLSHGLFHTIGSPAHIEALLILIEDRLGIDNSDKKYYLRVLYEGKSKKDELYFIWFCEWLKERCEKNFTKRIIPFCGRRKDGWTVLYKFEDKEFPMTQYVGSMMSWYGKICPWIWHMFNRKNIKHILRENEQSTLFFMRDFI